MSEIQTQVLAVVLMACGIIGIFGAAFFVMFPQNNLTEDLAASIFAEVVDNQMRWQQQSEVLK